MYLRATRSRVCKRGWDSVSLVVAERYINQLLGVFGFEVVAIGYLVKLWGWAGCKVGSWKCGAQEIEYLVKTKG